MSRIVDLTVTLKLELATRLERDEFYNTLEGMLRTGLGDILISSDDCVTVVATNDPDSVLSQAINLTPVFKPAGEIAFIWSVEDVLEMRPDLSEGQAREVLQVTKKYHDASFGINWDTLSYAAEMLYGDAPEPAEAKS